MNNTHTIPLEENRFLSLASETQSEYFLLAQNDSFGLPISQEKAFALMQEQIEISMNLKTMLWQLADMDDNQSNGEIKDEIKKYNERHDTLTTTMVANFLSDLFTALTIAAIDKA